MVRAGEEHRLLPCVGTRQEGKGFILRLLLAEVISPAQVLISDSKPHSVRVSWAPVPDSVAAYHVLYGPLPGNSVKLVEVEGGLNSTLLEGLAANTTYLVTVSAIYKSGKEKALSAKACTQEGEEEEEEEAPSGGPKCGGRIFKRPAQMHSAHARRPLLPALYFVLRARKNNYFTPAYFTPVGLWLRKEEC